MPLLFACDISKLLRSDLSSCPQAFGKRLREQGQRWVLLLDPPIHIKKGYNAYDSGIRNNVFLLDVTGQPYVGQVDHLYAIHLYRQVTAAQLLGLAVQILHNISASL